MAEDRPAVIGKKVIGRSVRGRPIRAWHLGEKGEPRVLLISTMHGDEPHTKRILTSLRDGRMRFLRNLRPKWILSFHQPLHGVDTLTKNKGYSRRVARALDLPRKRFSCGGVCHGTMTGWYNHRFRGFALTAEYGARPSRRRMQVTAPRQVLSIWGAHRHR